MITAKDWRPHASNTLLGFVTLRLSPSGIVLHDCTLHEKNGQRWISLPGRPQLDAEGRHRIDPSTSKKPYTAIVEIAGKAEREQFQRAALAAVDRLLGSGKTSR